jgi:uncharacterized protein
MVVKIEEIQAQGLDLQTPIAPAVLADALLGEDFKPLKSTPLKVHFDKVQGQVMVKGDLGLTLLAPCKRCLTDVTVEVPVRFSLRMVSQLKPRREEDELDVGSGKGKAGRRPELKEKDDDGHAEEAGSFELDEADAQPFDGKSIDLDPIVREQVLLALPVSVLCKDECKGLCTVCGQDLNEKECGCDRTMKDPRLAKLKDIKLH